MKTLKVSDDCHRAVKRAALDTGLTSMTVATILLNAGIDALMKTANPTKALSKMNAKQGGPTK